MFFSRLFFFFIRPNVRSGGMCCNTLALVCSKLCAMDCLHHMTLALRLTIQNALSLSLANRIHNEEKGEMNGVETQNLYTYRKPNQIKYEKKVEGKKGLRIYRTEESRGERGDEIGKI